MIRVPTDAAAAERARWLAELAKTLDEAQALMARLVIADGRQCDAFDVSARLEAARAEVQALRRGRIAEFAENSRDDRCTALPGMEPWPERSI